MLNNIEGGGGGKKENCARKVYKVGKSLFDGKMSGCFSVCATVKLKFHVWATLLLCFTQIKLHERNQHRNQETAWKRRSYVVFCVQLPPGCKEHSIVYIIVCIFLYMVYTIKRS